MTASENTPHDEAPRTGSGGDPLGDLAATPVERTASVRDPLAMPPVAGAADPRVLDTGLSGSPVTDETPAPPAPDESKDSGREA